MAKLSNSELEELLEAASAEKPGCSCGPQLAHAEHCPWVDWATARISAPLKLEALAPALARELLDRREVGQELAEALIELRIQLWRSTRHVPESFDIDPTTASIIVANEAEVAWVKLDEEEHHA